MRYSRISRRLGLFLAIYLVVFVCVSYLYITNHIEHRCERSHCEICSIISQVNSLLKSISIIQAVVLGIFFEVFLILTKQIYAYKPIVLTPVKSKVKLLN